MHASCVQRPNGRVFSAFVHNYSFAERMMWFCSYFSVFQSSASCRIDHPPTVEPFKNKNIILSKLLSSNNRVLVCMSAEGPMQNADVNARSELLTAASINTEVSNTCSMSATLNEPTEREANVLVFFLWKRVT